MRVSLGRASGETEAQVGQGEAHSRRSPALSPGGGGGQLGRSGSGAREAMRSEPWEQRNSVPGLAQWGRGPRDPAQSSLHWQ